MITEKLEKTLIDIALKIVKHGKGCLLVIETNPFEYELLYGNDIEKFSISGNERRLEILAMQEGACIISKDGKMVAYGAKISDTKIIPDFAMLHSAGYTASLKGNLVIFGSEEDKKVKLFHSGKLIMQIDTLEKGVEKNVSNAVDFLEAVGVGSLAAIGAPLIIPSLMAGITFTTGIIIYGSSYYLLQKFVDKIKYYFSIK
jgi:hypothetical protein